ncbi:MAG: hypothetical protein ABIK65_14750 [Candidatus Eisenbacteria bacterium]
MTDYFGAADHALEGLGGIPSLPVLSVEEGDLEREKDGVSRMLLPEVPGLDEVVRLRPVGCAPPGLEMVNGEAGKWIASDLSAGEGGGGPHYYQANRADGSAVLLLRFSPSENGGGRLRFADGTRRSPIGPALVTLSGRLEREGGQPEGRGWRFSEDRRSVVGDITVTPTTTEGRSLWLETDDPWLQVAVGSDDRPLWSSRATVSADSGDTALFRVFLPEFQVGSLRSSIRLCARDEGKNISILDELCLTFVHHSIPSLDEAANRIRNQIAPVHLPRGRGRLWVADMDNRRTKAIILTLGRGPLRFSDALGTEGPMRTNLPGLSRKLVYFLGLDRERGARQGTQSLKLSSGNEEALVEIPIARIGEGFRGRWAPLVGDRAELRIKPLLGVFLRYEVIVEGVECPVEKDETDRIVFSSEGAEALRAGKEAIVIERGSGTVHRFDLTGGVPSEKKRGSKKKAKKGGD